MARTLGLVLLCLLPAVAGAAERKPNLVIFLAERGLWVFAAVSALFVVAAAVSLAPLLRRDPIARFLALGMLLAVVPISATIPNDRNLFFGGTSAVERRSAATLGAAGDPRRGGHGVVVP